MLHQLPAEILQAVMQVADNRDLCTLSTLCHTLHVVSLSTLFSRTKTFEPLSTRRPGLVSKGGPPIKLFHQSHGLCITLESDENLIVLRGLRLALPYLFDELQVTAVLCTISAALPHNWTEIKSLERFLSKGHISASIENVVVDFAHSFDEIDEETIHEWDPTPECVAAIQRFLHLFSGANSKKLFPRCVSLSILHDTGLNYWDTMGLWVATKPNWLRCGSRAANLIQSLIAIASPRARSIFRSNSQITANPIGLHTLNIQLGFIFHPLFIDGASSMMAQYSDSLRSLSLDCITVSYWEWSSILARIYLPRLKELYLGRSYIKSGPLLNFLLRHRSIELLDLGSCDPKMRGGQPPGLLPNLKTLKAKEDVIYYFFPSHVVSSKLQFITLIFLTDHVGWLIFWHCLRTLYTSAPGFTYRLQIRVEARFPTSWLRLAAEGMETLNLDIAVVRTITSIEVYTWEVPTLLETEETRLDLVNWLEIFPEVVEVDVVGCNPMNEAAWKELRILVKGRVPRIVSLRIGGRDLNTSMD
ncbi:hypothetical protein AX16_001084 [Volvariella volvacea WC 439]|nr:hypothetical protein AX16_001084 [Volvariella volvacea WC 439]